MPDLLKSFIIGSSLPATAVSMLYIGRAFLQHPCDKSDLRYEHLAIVVPFMYGLFNMISTSLFTVTRTSMIITGILMGIIFSNVGTHAFGLPTKIFNFSEDRWYMAMVLAPGLYAAIWGFVLYYLNKKYL